MYAEDSVQKKQSKNLFNIMSHHQNYLFFGGYSDTPLIEKHWDSNGVRDTDEEYDRHSVEVQFQLSIKLPLYSNIFDTGADLFAAYTQNSYWQIYDTERSSPFRETNYMPEFFLQWKPETKIGNSTIQKVQLGLIHQSNGKNIGASRSWNRTELSIALRNQNISYGLSAWDRWQEDPKEDISKAQGDDNPDLEEYIGKQSYFIAYKNDNYTLSLTHQNNIFAYDITKGNSKLDLTLPSSNTSFDFFIRYFHGYGESLIDYNVKINRINFGIIIAN